MTTTSRAAAPATRRSLARCLFVALAVDARRSVARGFLAHRSRRSIGGRLLRERVVEGLPAALVASRFSHRELCL